MLQQLMPELSMPADGKPLSRRTPRHVRGHLQANAAAAALLTDLERREALLKRVRDALPAPLAKHCVQASLEDGRLSLIVDAPVWVDQLRFVAPQLALQLGTGLDANMPDDAHPFPIQDFRVRAQPALLLGAENPLSSWARGRAGPTAIGAVEATAAAFGATPLGDSMRRLATTLRDRAG